MSNPENPLSIYRSYSYHHVLIACNTSEVAEHIARSDELLTFLRPSASSENLYKAKTIDNKGSYVVIINGLTDANFTIENVSWFSTTANDTGGKDNMFTTMAVEGEMKVLEPQGIRFLNVMNNVSDELRTDPNGIVWMLKTIFIGHRRSTSDNDVGDYPDYILNIKPLMFCMYDITANFGIEGGEYIINFVALENGAAKQPHYIRAADAVSINLSGDNTLKNAVSLLQDAIRDRYIEYYAKVTNSGENITGRYVLYQIEIDDKYDDTYKIDSNQALGKNTGASTEGGIFDFSKGKSIEVAIQELMRSCSKVGEDLKAKKEKRYTYKIVSSLSSTEDIITVTYKVIRFIEATNNIVEGIQDKTIDDKDLEKNLIVFDYIYTGLNVDIIDFDIKMEMGLAFFQTLQTNNAFGDAKDLPPSKVTEASANKNLKKGQTDIPRNLTPIFFPRLNDDPKSRNVPNPTSHMEFQALLARHAALENIDSRITIHGNPGLLSSTASYPSDFRDKTSAQLIAEADTTNAIPNWGRVPAIAKINIKMPSADKDNQQYAESFWYDGYYYIYAITHKFDGGLFTQDIEMVSLPNTQDSTPSEDDTITQDDASTSETNIPSGKIEEKQSKVGIH